MKDVATRFTTQALVLKETQVGESDRLVTLFTREYGIIRAFASGAKKLGSKKASATSLLSYSDFSIIKRKDTYKIYEAESIKVFFGAGSDILRLSISQYFCELALKMLPEGTVNDEFLRLLLNSLYFLAEGKRNPLLIKAITEFRAVSMLGFAPNLIACSSCGKFEDDVMYFSMTDGEIYCKDCKNSSSSIPINRTLLSAMRHIVFSEFNNIYSFEIPDDQAALLSDIAQNYVIVQTDYRFSTLDFLNMIKE